MEHEGELRRRVRALIGELDQLQEQGVRFRYPLLLPITEIPPAGHPLVREFAEAQARVRELHEQLVSGGWLVRVRLRIWLEED